MSTRHIGISGSLGALGEHHTDLYANISNKRDPKAAAKAVFKGQSYDAWVTVAPHGAQLSGI